MKAIALLSGGLDSTLACKLTLEQGIEVIAVNFLTVFCTCTPKGKSCLVSKSAALKLGIELKVFEVSKEYLEIVKKPKYGYGSNLNPCIDCRIFMFKKAGEIMRQIDASFLITGEVLGERPMSQRKEAMKIIEKEAGLEGLILRPLSAKLLEPTIPEKQGWVDRKKLLAIKGRSRKPQIQLAKKFSINGYPCPAGGCLLTNSGFAKRIRDLMKYKLKFGVNDVQLLKTGRYFRLNKNAMLIVGRNKEENDKLLKLAKEDDLYFYPLKVKGPVGIGRGHFENEDIFTSAGIIARYCDGSLEQELEIGYKVASDDKSSQLSVLPLRQQKFEALRI
jgi:tRNA U34 2-thiouridine synthase MnmA/TrmU